MPRESKTSARRALAVQRETQIMDLRIKGYSVPKIAQALGMSVAGVHKGLKRALANAREVSQDTVEDFRVIESMRLDELRVRLGPKVKDGDVAAIAEARKISESFRKLWGVDAPTQTVLTGPDGGPVMVASWADVVKSAREAEDAEVVDTTAEPAGLLSAGIEAAASPDAESTEAAPEVPETSAEPPPEDGW